MEEREQLDFGFSLDARDCEAVLLRRLTRSGSFRAVKQPIKRLSDRRTSAYELLSRSPLSGSAPTSDFLDYCERHNVLTVLDLHCLERCAAAARSLAPELIRHLNLFPSTLASVPVERILETLSPPAPGRFCLELNENFLGAELSGLIAPVRALRRAGVLVAIDDVGCGRSCLESLLTLEPDLIKIDKGLVTGAARYPGRERALKRLIEVARTLEAGVIAEGIEGEEDLDCLTALGVPYGQGFLWGRPN